LGFHGILSVSFSFAKLTPLFLMFSLGRGALLDSGYCFSLRRESLERKFSFFLSLRLGFFENSGNAIIKFPPSAI